MNNVYKIDIVLPVYYKNISVLEESTAKVLDHLRRIQGPYSFKIIISINGPRANDLIQKAEEICKKYDSVDYCYTEQQGKGHGVLYAWQSSCADILTYMDIDLATSLESFLPLIDGITNGADISVGSRYLATSNLKRSIRRYILSRIYHSCLINAFLGVPINDVQCGFKAIDRTAFQKLSPHILDYGFFFEAEMLYSAHRMGMKIVEVPVSWTERTVSGVRLFSTSVSFIIGTIRLKFPYLL
jgi:glycosyltransferase AglD